MRAHANIPNALVTIELGNKLVPLIYFPESSLRACGKISFIASMNIMVTWSVIAARPLEFH
jgi:hypothetical protein